MSNRSKNHSVDKDGRIEVAPIPIYSNPTISLDEIKHRRFKTVECQAKIAHRLYAGMGVPCPCFKHYSGLRTRFRVQQQLGVGIVNVFHKEEE